MNATCSNINGMPICACKSGYTGNGFSCTPKDPCATNNGGCNANATCANMNGVAACTCKSGFDGNGFTCTDINECNASPCDPHATCANTDGSYKCTCLSGFTGDGKTCTAVNPCDDNNGGCDVHATCTSTGGSITCKCVSPYVGTGVTCTYQNPCGSFNGGCDFNANCSDSDMNGVPECACKSGYTGDGKTCAVADPCVTNNGGCDPVNATCTSTGPTTVQCTCKSGYTGSGVSCTDVNECNGAPCDTHATCSNTPGSYTCQCNGGYSGNGKTCMADNLSAQEAMHLATISDAFKKFHMDTTGWPLGNTAWYGDCTVAPQAAAFTTNDTVLFKAPSAVTGCDDIYGMWDGTVPPTQPPYFSGVVATSMASSTMFDAWGNVLLYAYFRPDDGFGYSNPNAPDGAIIIWSTGPDGLDQTGCSTTKKGTPPGCLRNENNLVSGQASVSGADDIIVVVGPAIP